jgi:hypothetical protein
LIILGEAILIAVLLALAIVRKARESDPRVMSGDVPMVLVPMGPFLRGSEPDLALARQMLTIIYYMLLRNTPYQERQQG